jgi:DNA topoisomerase-1
MTDVMRVFAGECTTIFEGTRERTQHGHVVVLVKPDRTVLVHDADGYQPVAWLTRPDSLTVEANASVDDSVRAGGAERTGGGFGITARAGDQTLRVVSHRTFGSAQYPTAPAGVPVGTCPSCDDVLVRTGGEVVCLDCGDQYPLPSGASVLESTCADCGLPTVRVERGNAFEVCLDRSCDPLDERVRERFDGEWSCPGCGKPLRVRRRGAGLVLGCDGYPDCETSVSIPAGIAVARCECGLPVFETAAGRRCLDATCDRTPD